MPRKSHFTKEQIIEVAIDIVRKSGHEVLSARTICGALGCSVAPLFTVYHSMEEILDDTRKAAEQMFSDYVDDVLEYKPSFKEFGMRVVRFSKEEPNIFYYMFLDKNSNSYIADTKALECLKLTESEFGLSAEEAMKIYRHMWPFTCGLAMLCNKTPDHYSDAMISEMLSSQFMSQMMLVKSGRPVMNIHPHLSREGDTIVLRRWLDSDARDLYEFARDPEVSKSAGWSVHESEEHSQEIIRKVLKKDGIWAIQHKESGRVIGSIGYKTAAFSNIEMGDSDVEVGFGIAKQYWDHGICCEALHILIDYCMRVKSFKTLWAESLTDNPASGRALEKCGFVFSGVETTNEEGKTVRLMKLERR